MSLCAGFRTAVAARDHGPRLLSNGAIELGPPFLASAFVAPSATANACRSFAHRSEGQCQKIAFGLATVALLLPIPHRLYRELWLSVRFVGKKRADERTRTADLLITSVRSGVAGGCTRLQIPRR